MTTTPVVTIEDDATPLVRSLARTLRASLRVPELGEVAVGINGSLALASVADAQSATVTFEPDEIHVAHGVGAGLEPVGLHFIPEYTLGESADPLAAATARLLSPPLPTWRDAAVHFWEVNRDSRGFPTQLRVVCLDEDAEVRCGDGTETFEVHGDAEAISSVLSGQGDNFLFAVAAGLISIRGRSAHMSVMSGAHWKVRFDG